MQKSFDRTLARVWRRRVIRFVTAGSVFAAVMSIAYATETSGSVYPVGAETELTGTAPGPGQTLLVNFENFYMANGLANSKGQSEIPGFHLRVGAAAVKVVHNWGISILGGTLVSAAALPLIYEHVDGPFRADKTGIGNPDIEVGAVTYVKGSWHWWYGFDMYTPGFSYNKNDLINIGQHNFAYAPLGAISYLPEKGGVEFSSKIQYIINQTDSATDYKSGREFIWEYAGMKNVTKHLALGMNGYWYQQTSNDLLNGLMLGDGIRGRDFTFGPQIRAEVGHFLLIAKYQKDSLVENRPMGHSLWFEFGVPLGHPHQ